VKFGPMHAVERASVEHYLKHERQYGRGRPKKTKKKARRKTR